MILEADLDTIIFMKVGRHAGETFDEILARKRREYDDAGQIFWGYGGGTMHPIQRVQPFVRMHIEQGKHVTLVMEEIDSRHPATEVYASDYSANGVDWLPIPTGVRVRGSRYALVLGEIREGDLELDLARYRVGSGPSAGKSSGEYLRGRVDKGCLERADPYEASRPIHVKYVASLKEPYAVLIK